MNILQNMSGKTSKNMEKKAQSREQKSSVCQEYYPTGIPCHSGKPFGRHWDIQYAFQIKVQEGWTFCSNIGHRMFPCKAGTWSYKKSCKA